MELDTEFIEREFEKFFKPLYGSDALITGKSCRAFSEHIAKLTRSHERGRLQGGRRCGMSFAESSDFPRTNTGKRILNPDEARLREEFAKAVLPVCYQEAIEEFKRAGFPDEHWRIGVALDAYAMADAMLIARKQEA